MAGPRPLRRLAFVLPFALLALPAAAGIDRFTATGPLNGDLVNVVVDPVTPGTLLALTDYGGLFRSTDGGHSWSASGTGLSPGVQAIAADPATPGSFYAITTAEVFHSADGGRHWLQVSSGQSFPVIYTPHSRTFAVLTLLPGGPGAPPTLLATAPHGVQRSGDGGVTWRTVFAFPAFFIATRWHPVADPTDPRRAWFFLSGLLESTDAGQTWLPVASFPEPQALGLDLLVLPMAPATILVATPSALWKSTDDGASWRKVGQDLSPVAYETQTPSLVYARNAAGTLWVSADDGESWTPRAIPLPGVPLPAPGTRTLYAFGTNDISTSPDRGRHWSLTAESGTTPIFFGATLPIRLRFQPGDPATAYAVAGGRAFRSADGGASWASFATDRAPLHSTVAQDLVLDPANRDLLYLATDHGVFRSADSGASWGSTTAESFTRLESAGRALLGAGCGVQRSTNGGRTWRATLPCLRPSGGLPRRIDRLIVDPRDPDVVYAGGLDASGPSAVPPPSLWQSLDNGATWRRLVPDGNVAAVDPTRTGRLYVARPAGLERSDDGGRTFRMIHPFPAGGLGFSDLSALLVDGETPTTLYAGSLSHGVWRSTDGGVTWAPVNAGLLRPNALGVRDLVLHPTVPHLLYAELDDALFQSRFTAP